MDYIKLLPRLKQIWFHYSRNLLDKLPLLPNIRRLRLWFDEKDEKYFRKYLDKLCHVFQYVEHLHLMICITNEVIYYLIQQLDHLSSIAIFYGPNGNILKIVDRCNTEETFVSVIPIYFDIPYKKLVVFGSTLLNEILSKTNKD